MSVRVTGALVMVGALLVSGCEASSTSTVTTRRTGAETTADTAPSAPVGVGLAAVETTRPAGGGSASSAPRATSSSARPTSTTTTKPSSTTVKAAPSTTRAATTKPSGSSRMSPLPGGECPASAPVKGNKNSGIYHVPGGQYYGRTKAEECFSTAAAAEAAGYRAPKK